MPIKPSTDGALSLAVARHTVNDVLHDAAHLKRYTDVPLRAALLAKAPRHDFSATSARRAPMSSIGG